MTQVTISSRMPSLPLKNVDSEIDLDNLIKNLNNVLGNYLEIFNLYKTKRNEDLVDNCAKRHLNFQSLENRLTWSSENNSNLFIRINDNGDWIENVNGEDKFKFKFVKYDHDSGGLLLFDNVRNVYVEIDGQQARVGKDLKNLSKMYTGSWIGFDSSQDLKNFILKDRLKSILEVSNDTLFGSSNQTPLLSNIEEGREKKNAPKSNEFRFLNLESNLTDKNPAEESISSYQETNTSDLIPLIVANHHDYNESKSNINKPAWLSNNDYNLFEKISENKWVESLGGQPTFQFDQIEIDRLQNSVVLFDPKRNVIVELNENDSNYGPNKEELRSLYNGRWLHYLNNNNNKEQNNSFDVKKVEPEIDDLG